MKVVTQITANLAALTSQHKFELPPIYLPSKVQRRALGPCSCS